MKKNIQNHAGCLSLIFLILFTGTSATAWDWPWNDDWYPCQGTAGKSCNFWDYGWECCGDLTCDLFAGAICRHDPAWEGEVCSVDIYNVGSGLCKDPDKFYCKGFQQGLAGKCTAYSKVGESCDGIVTLCGNILGNTGRMCRPSRNPLGWPFYDDLMELVCYPNILSFDPGDPGQCKEAWSKSFHDKVIDDGNAVDQDGNRLYHNGLAVTYSSGGGVSAYASETYEVGTAYASDSTYSCFETLCVGAGTNVSVFQTFVSFSVFAGYQAFKDGWLSLSQSYSEYVGWTYAQIFGKSDNALSLELGGQSTFWLSADVDPAPVGLGLMACYNNIRNTFKMTPEGNLEAVAQPPLLECLDTSVCADPATCTAQASISKNPGAEPVPVTQIPAGPYAIGSRQVTLAPVDADAARSCSATLEVNDCTPPQIQCPSPVTVECQMNGTASVNLGAPTVKDCSSYDVFWPDDKPYPLGTTKVSYMAIDKSSNAAKCDTTVTVVDTLPPEIRSLTATPSVLWPPNHKMQNIHLDITAVDICGSGAICKVSRITSSEGIDGRTGSSDMEIINDTTVSLRAERSGSGAGRTYTIWVECRDGKGNVRQSSVNVAAPHANSKKP